MKLEDGLVALGDGLGIGEALVLSLHLIGKNLIDGVLNEFVN